MGSSQSVTSPPRDSRRISLPPPPKPSSSPDPESTDGEILTFPDLVKSIPFPIRLNPHTRLASAESDAFIMEYGKFSEKQLKKFVGLNAGLLCGMCYAECEPEQLRVCCDFMSFLFNLDDWSDEFDTTGTKGLEEAVMNTLWHPETYHSDSVAACTAKSCVCNFNLFVTTLINYARRWWLRMLKTVGPRCRRRFVDTLELYFKAIMQQAADRAAKRVPELEAYISLRRDTSGCKTGFSLIEYAAGIDLPDEVVEHPVIQSLLDATNDSVSWANVSPSHAFLALRGTILDADRLGRTSSLTTGSNQEEM